MNSNLLARPSLKRKATQPPATTPQVQMKRTRLAKPSIHSSTLYKTQNTPVAPLPPIVSQTEPVPFLEQPISAKPGAIHQVQIKRKRSAKPSILSSTLYKAQIAHVAPLPPIVSKAAPTLFLKQPISAIPAAIPLFKMKRARSAKPSIHSSTLCKAQNAHVASLPQIVSQVAPAPFLEQPISSKPAITPQVQMKRTRSARPSIRSSTLYKAQNAPVSLFPPIVSQAAPAPFPKQTISSKPSPMPQVQIKWTRSAKPSILSSTLYKAQNAHVAPLPPVVSQAALAPFLEQTISSKPADMAQVQMKRARSAKPSIRSSTLYKAKNAPVAPLPPIASQAELAPFIEQPISSVPPVRVKALFLPTTHDHPSARMSPPPHIKWQGILFLALIVFSFYVLDFFAYL